jgi:N-acetylneuraminic acid mutarotase
MAMVRHVDKKGLLSRVLGSQRSMPLALLLVGSLFTGLFAQEGMWTAHTALPSARGEFTAGAVGGRLIACGGLQGIFGTPTERVEAYDVTEGRWVPLAPLPQPLNHHAVAVIDSTLYVTGGSSGRTLTLGGALPTLYAYDVATDRWTRKADMPAPRWGHGAAVVGGKLYVVGGIGGNEDGPVLEYDPQSDHWARRAALPTPRDHLSVLTVGNKLYAIGGRRQGENVAAVEVYDPATDRWAAAAPLPTPRSGMAVGFVGGRIAAIGGEDMRFFPGQVFPVHERYDPETDRWAAGPQPPTPRHGAAAAVVDNMLYVIGGATRHGAFSVLGWSGAVEAFTPQ